MVKTQTFCNQYVEKYCPNTRVFEHNQNFDQFVKFLLNNVLMIYVGSEELDDAFRLFTVMNNRGVKLRSSDILKASNLARLG